MGRISAKENKNDNFTLIFPWQTNKIFVILRNPL